MQHDLRLFVDTRADQRIDERIGAMYMHGFGLLLLDDLLEHFPIGEGNILTHEREIHGHAIDGHATNVLFAIHAVRCKTDDHIVVVRHPFGQIHGYGLDAAQVGVVVLGNV